MESEKVVLTYVGYFWLSNQSTILNLVLYKIHVQQINFFQEAAWPFVSNTDKGVWKKSLGNTHCVRSDFKMDS